MFCLSTYIHKICYIQHVKRTCEKRVNVVLRFLTENDCVTIFCVCYYLNPLRKSLLTILYFAIIMSTSIKKCSLSYLVMKYSFISHHKKCNVISQTVRDFFSLMTIGASFIKTLCSGIIELRAPFFTYG